MRRLSLAVTCFLLAALPAPSVSFAAGNVLLPSSGDSGDSSYLGLSAAPPAPSAAPATAPASISTPAPDTPPPATAAASSAMPQAEQISLPKAPVISPIDSASAAHLPPGTIPTQVIQQPDASAMFAQAGKSLPYGITLAIDGKSIFGAKDVQAITDKLGLSREQIPASCILSLRGIMQTDKGTYILDGGASPQVPVRYDGAIRSYLMTAAALCTAGRLPPGSGFLTQTNGRFNISLQPINCAPPNRQVSQLTITYNGSDTAQCTYQ